MLVTFGIISGAVTIVTIVGLAIWSQCSGDFDNWDFEYDDDLDE